LQTWKPTVDSKIIDTSFPTYEAYMESLDEDKKVETKMLETHWPPKPEEVGELKLERW
jgi:multisite-specific tRNA:(cytosine-C5)-methyltransferase